MSLVLLYEPDLDAREGMRAQLDAFGLDVVEAATAREAELLSALYDPELTVFARRLATGNRPGSGHLIPTSDDRTETRATFHVRSPQRCLPVPRTRSHRV